MTVGHSYVILAMFDKDDGKYRPSDAEFDASDQQLLTRLATACGLQAVYPHGMYQGVKHEVMQRMLLANIYASNTLAYM